MLDDVVHGAFDGATADVTARLPKRLVADAVPVRGQVPFQPRDRLPLGGGPLMRAEEAEPL
jgi:hypothetical protein